MAEDFCDVDVYGVFTNRRFLHSWGTLMVSDLSADVAVLESPRESGRALPGERWRRVAFCSALVMAATSLMPLVYGQSKSVPGLMLELVRDLDLASDYSVPFELILKSLSWSMAWSPIVLLAMSARAVLLSRYRGFVAVAGAVLTLATSIPLLHMVAHEMPRGDAEVWGITFSIASVMVLASGISVFESRRWRDSVFMVFPLAIVPALACAFGWISLMWMMIPLLVDLFNGAALTLTQAVWIVCVIVPGIGHVVYLGAWVLWFHDERRAQARPVESKAPLTPLPPRSSRD